VGGLCTNTQLRGDLLEAAVWAEVRALLENPRRLEDEYRRRLAAPEIDPDLDTIKAQIAKVKQTISRLIDGYADGLIDKDEFTLRIRRIKERSARLEEQLRSQVELAAQRRELLLLITRLEDFFARIKDGLQHADWNTKRDLVRALVRRVDIGPDGVNVVFRVHPAIPSSVPPEGIMPDCTRGEVAAERHVAANKDLVSYGHREPHTLVMAVADADGESATLHFGREVQGAEHLHSVRGHRVLVVDNADVTKP
jgi:hypothetical protein